MNIPKKLIYLYITLISLGVSITLYFFIMKHYFKDKIVDNDFMNKQIFKMPIFGKNCCSWWPVSHFISYMLFALIWPEYWYHLFILGVLWEFVEWIFKYLFTPKGKELKFKRTRTGEGVEYEQWWSSSSKDVLFNGAGILVGLTIKKILNNK